MSFANPGPPIGPGILDGANLFIVIGNHTNVATSTELALIDTGLRTAGSDIPIPNSLEYSLTGRSNLLIDEFVGGVTLDWTNANGDSAYTTVGLRLAVPELSSSLLFGLASLALYNRRRRESI